MFILNQGMAGHTVDELLKMVLTTFMNNSTRLKRYLNTIIIAAFFEHQYEAFFTNVQQYFLYRKKIVVRLKVSVIKRNMKHRQGNNNFRAPCTKQFFGWKGKVCVYH